MFERSIEVVNAAMEQAGGFGVAKDGEAVVKAEVFGDLGLGVPAEKPVFDFRALRMIADGAFAGVARGGTASGGRRGMGITRQIAQGLGVAHSAATRSDGGGRAAGMGARILVGARRRRIVGGSRARASGDGADGEIFSEFFFELLQLGD
ncbi:MAG TPA: hypothetical protein VJR23_16955 [Candidatus Acidoferrales bacterium]|nr:hypothetical protein [Candidatus Acidoferrales bacterium]